MLLKTAQWVRCSCDRCSRIYLPINRVQIKGTCCTQWNCFVTLEYVTGSCPVLHVNNKLFYVHYVDKPLLQGYMCGRAWLRIFVRDIAVWCRFQPIDNIVAWLSYDIWFLVAIAPSFLCNSIGQKCIKQVNDIQPIKVFVWMRFFVIFHIKAYSL